MFFITIQYTISIVLPQTRVVDIRGGSADTYVVSFPRITKLVEFPAEGCPEKSNTPGILQEHFMYRQWNEKVSIVHEGPEPLPQCDQ